jgi:hypothetical protein
MLVGMTAKRRMTMADIKRAAEIAGSPYFERGSVRFFGGDKNSGPYVGPGGIYFAQSNRAGHKVKHVTLEPWSIHTAEDATSHVNAREQAKALARSSPSQAARADHATKKSPAQLQREIDEVLAGKGTSRGSHHSSISDSDKIRNAIANFPSTFGLRGFPGGVFRISPTSSYVSGGRVMLYTERKDNGDWLDFSKGTEAELRSEVTSLASTGGRSHSTKVPTNREGLTWEEWRNAARFAAPRTGLSPGLIKAWRSEWRKGTDPSEMGTED